MHSAVIPKPGLVNTMSASRAEVEGIGRSLRERCRGPVLTGHCTGDRATGVLAGVLGDQLQLVRTGTVAEL